MYLNLHLDVIMAVLIGAAIAYPLGWLRGRTRRKP